MKIRVTKASKRTYWYAKRIGEVFETDGKSYGSGLGYRVEDCRDGTDDASYIDVEDCEVVKEAVAIENVTVLVDELGLQREYREVKRKAVVGERIKFTGFNRGFSMGNADHYPQIGDVLTVSGRYDNQSPVNEGAVGVRVSGKPNIRDNEYAVLEPSDIVRIEYTLADGKGTKEIRRFRLVERKAGVGERVVVVTKQNDSFRHEPYRVGDVVVVVESTFDGHIQRTKQHNFGISERHYAVLEPLTGAVDAASTPLSSKPENAQTAEIIGHLTVTVSKLNARVTELERKNASLERKYAELAVKVRVNAEEEGVRDGIERLERGNKLETAPLDRDTIVGLAKDDVAELLRIGGDQEARLPEESPLYSKFYKVEFVVNRDKRTVAALVKYRFGIDRVIARGIAKAAPGDVFNASIGRAISLRRALGLAVPDYYVNAPKPTGVRVGDVVHGANDGYYSKDRTFTLTGTFDGRAAFRYAERLTDWIYSFQIGGIVDDSRDEVAEAEGA